MGSRNVIFSLTLMTKEIQPTKSLALPKCLQFHQTIRRHILLQMGDTTDSNIPWAEFGDGEMSLIQILK